MLWFHLASLKYGNKMNLGCKESATKFGGKMAYKPYPDAQLATGMGKALMKR